MALADPKKFQEKLKKTRQESEERDAQRRASSLGFSYIDLKPFPIQIEALGLVEEEAAKENLLATIAINKGHDVVLVAQDPTTKGVQSVVEDLKNKKYNPLLFVCSQNGLQIAWDSYKFVPKKIKKRIIGEVVFEEGHLKELRATLHKVSDAQEAITKFQDSNTSKILEFILASALVIGASDIHIEPHENIARLRFRIDGELNDITELASHVYKALDSRIKLLSHLKLNVRGEPQDGRFTIKTGEKSVEIRTSLVPAEHGETIVLRVLDPDSIKAGLEDLGFRKEDLEIIKNTLLKPNGMILNTGPTGSGKTTTLYAFIKYIYTSTIKIITIEDPIEYHLTGISQTQVDSTSGYTFSSGLKSILRQDPDVILVGEIRDLDTAEIAMHAALTGHVVFSTLHTNEAAGSVPRLINMGVKPPVIAPALNLVIAQRLIRKLCNTCKHKVKLDENMKNKLGTFMETLPKRIKKPDSNTITVYEVGQSTCNKCHEGHKGRIGVFELFVMNEQLEKLIHADSAKAEIKKSAIQSGMLTMQQDGILKVLDGITTFEEIRRATGPLPFDK